MGSSQDQSFASATYHTQAPTLRVVRVQSLGRCWWDAASEDSCSEAGGRVSTSFHPRMIKPEFHPIIIDPEFRSLIPSMSAEERAQLKENIRQDGLRDPLVVWKHGDDFILIDGHNRFDILNELNTSEDNPHH